MISKETLEKLYNTQEMSMNEISKVLNVSVGSVFNYLKKYNIKSRPKMTEKTKKKISKANKGKVSPNKGKKLPIETKLKISISKKGKFRKPSKYGGHKKIRQDGYVKVYTPNHPKATKDGYVMEHILVMEEKIGRYLKTDEVVHHKNKKRNDNRLENLQLMTLKEHASLHMKERWEKKRSDDLSTK